MSQFDSLFKKSEQSKSETKPKPDSAKENKKQQQQTKTSSSPEVKAKPKAAAQSPPAKAEKRTIGKSSNSDYTQVLTYVRRDTHNRVKAALIFDERKRDLSDLVEELLAGWLKGK